MSSEEGATVGVVSGKRQTATGIARGLNKGHVVELRAERPRPSQRKGIQGKRTGLVRDLIREVVGLAPYEKKMLDTIKVLGSGGDKKLYKMAKKRLGTHKRAVAKREELKGIYAIQRSRG